jgi:hypothetical protein
MLCIFLGPYITNLMGHNLVIIVVQNLFFTGSHGRHDINVQTTQVDECHMHIHIV